MFEKQQRDDVVGRVPVVVQQPCPACRLKKKRTSLSIGVIILMWVCVLLFWKGIPSLKRAPPQNFEHGTSGGEGFGEQPSQSFDNYHGGDHLGDQYQGGDGADSELTRWSNHPPDGMDLRGPPMNVGGDGDYYLPPMIDGLHTPEIPESYLQDFQGLQGGDGAFYDEWSLILIGSQGERRPPPMIDGPREPKIPESYFQPQDFQDLQGDGAYYDEWSGGHHPPDGMDHRGDGADFEWTKWGNHPPHGEDHLGEPIKGGSDMDKRPPPLMDGPHRQEVPLEESMGIPTKANESDHTWDQRTNFLTRLIEGTGKSEQNVTTRNGHTEAVHRTTITEAALNYLNHLHTKLTTNLPFWFSIETSFVSDAISDGKATVNKTGDDLDGTLEDAQLYTRSDNNSSTGDLLVQVPVKDELEETVVQRMRRSNTEDAAAPVLVTGPMDDEYKRYKRQRGEAKLHSWGHFYLVSATMIIVWVCWFLIALGLCRQSASMSKKAALMADA